MELKIKDIVKLLQVEEKTVYKWIKDKKIPAYKIHNQYRFNKGEINDWILRNKIRVSSKVIELHTSNKHISLLKLLKNGGIFYNVGGENVLDVIKNAVNTIPTPKETDKETIIFFLLQREEMMPTAVGNGVAIPHPRTPLITDIEDERISICFLNSSIDFKAIDGEPVHTMFVIFSANPSRHLEILSKISFLCQQDDFIEILKNRTASEEIFNFIENKEAGWGD